MRYTVKINRQASRDLTEILRPDNGQTEVGNSEKTADLSILFNLFASQATPTIVGSSDSVLISASGVFGIRSGTWSKRLHQIT